MKKYIVYAMVLLTFTHTSCNDNDEGVAPADIVNLTSEALPGAIQLNWAYSNTENHNIRYVEVRYFDPAKQQEVKKTASSFSDGILIDDLRLKYGEYKFEIQPFSTSFTPGAVHELPLHRNVPEWPKVYQSRADHHRR